ncbi:MAG: transposase [Candidatus Eremiobacteraeota bacterium]|nr:transposase [Candidatus Eremiobacteraeota bacterium]MBC5821456.1 transposase [Candidatus Eremiobacteraeota bacterium]
MTKRAKVLEAMEIHFLQQWHDLSDPAAEEALYDVVSMRRFAGVDLGNAPVPDETTICKFRHLLEQHSLGEKIFDDVKAHLQEKGVSIGTCFALANIFVHKKQLTRLAGA